MPRHRVARRQGRRFAARGVGGTGHETINQGFFAVRRACVGCGGDGLQVEDPCPECDGHGLVANRREVAGCDPRGHRGRPRRARPRRGRGRSAWWSARRPSLCDPRTRARDVRPVAAGSRGSLHRGPGARRHRHARRARRRADTRRHREPAPRRGHGARCHAARPRRRSSAPPARGPRRARKPLRPRGVRRPARPRAHDSERPSRP